MDEIVTCDNCGKEYQVNKIKLEDCTQKYIRFQKYQPLIWCYVFKCTTCCRDVTLKPVEDPVAIH